MIMGSTSSKSSVNKKWKNIIPKTKTKKYYENK